jgi:hypothetical protein
VIDLHSPTVDQPVQIALKFQAILKATYRKKQLHVISIKKHSYVLKDLSDFIHKPDEAEGPKWLPCGTLEVTNQILVHDPVHQQSELLDNSRQYRNAKVIRYVIPPTTLENGSYKREFPFIGEDTRYQ